MEYTLEAYKERLAAIEEEKKQKENEVIREFALALNPYKKGDIIKDSEGGMIIQSIRLNRAYSNKLPYCTYRGTELKKDGTPRKVQRGRSIAQFNIIK
jgi:hypothetical protein